MAWERSLIRLIRRAIAFALVELPGFISARRRIRDDIRRRDEAFEERLEQETAAAEVLSNTDMDRFEELERDRLQSVESKARTNLISITTAVSIAAVLLGAQFTQAECGCSAHYPSSAIVGYISIALGWLYFVLSGWFSLQVLDVWRRYTVVPANHVNSNKVELRARRLFNLEQNQSLMILKVNALSVSFHSIRNGIILFFLGMVMIAMARLGTFG